MENQSSNRKIVQLLLIVSILFVLLTGGGVYFSYFKQNNELGYKCICHSIDINMSADSVFRFLGNSDNARKWSVFVNHITPLNADSVPDGQVGSIRRCYCFADNTGRQWDELTTEVTYAKKRQLIIYNLQDFSVSAENLATEQRYEALSDHSCRLTFTVFFKDAVPGFWEVLKTHYASYKIKSIFEGNLANIKRIVETGQ